jgi:hypothetical protein
LVGKNFGKAIDSAKFSYILGKMINELKKFYRESQQRRRNKAIDDYFKKESYVAYHSLISQRPEHALSKKQVKEIETYAADVFGSASFSPWLKVFTVCRGEFVEGWIPRDYWARIVCTSLNDPLRPFGKIKSLTQKFLSSEALPDLAYFVNGSWLMASGEKTNPFRLKKFVFDQHPYVFLKQDNTSGGGGVVRLDPMEFSSVDFNQLGNFVIQAPIEPHYFFKRLCPANVPSIRITTYKPAQQQAVLVQAGIRLGLQGNKSVLGDDCITVAVRIQDGGLHDFGFSKKWEFLYQHTETGISFSGLHLPKFKEMSTLCETLHDRNPAFGLIAWDVVVDNQNQIKIMEWNTVTPTYSMDEAAIGPLFKGLGFEKLWKTKKQNR